MSDKSIQPTDFVGQYLLELMRLQEETQGFAFVLSYLAKDKEWIIRVNNRNETFKSEYLIDSHPDKCKGCSKCVAKCQFKALTFNYLLNRTSINYEKCFGCGVCRHACKNDALYLRPRNEFASFKGKY